MTCSRVNHQDSLIAEIDEGRDDELSGGGTGFIVERGEPVRIVLEIDQPALL